MLNTNAVNESNSKKYAREFFGKLWLDALADKEMNYCHVDWLDDWYESYEPSKDTNVDYLVMAGNPKDFLESYSMMVYENMCSFIDERKNKIS